MPEAEQSELNGPGILPVRLQLNAEGTFTNHQKSYYMSDLLSQAIELPIYMYSKLTDPIFMGQTSTDDDGTYWVVVKSNSKLFKFHLFC